MIISVDHGNKSIKTPNALFTSGLIVSEGLFSYPCAPANTGTKSRPFSHESGRLFCCLDWEHDPCPALAIGLVARLQVVRPHPQTKRLGGKNENYQNQRLLWHLSGNSCQR